jgi:hypothetical protein
MQARINGGYFGTGIALAAYVVSNILEVGFG